MGKVNLFKGKSIKHKIQNRKSIKRELKIGKNL